MKLFGFKNLNFSARAIGMALTSSLLFATGAISTPVYADTHDCFTYRIDESDTEPSDGTDVHITSGASCTGDLTIPGTFVEGTDAYNVVGIDTVAIQGNSAITSLYIPNSVVTIGNYAFADQANLLSVVFQSGSSLTDINSNVFGYDTSLVSVLLPTSVEEIHDQAFYQATALKTINISGLNLLSSIGSQSFQGTSLQSVTIPNSVSTLGDSAFRDCSKLTTLRFAFGSSLMQIPSYFLADSAVNSVRLPATIEVIGDMAFSNTNLATISLPSNLKSINYKAFFGSKKLTDIDFSVPTGLLSIGSQSFQGTSLNVVDIPSSITTIGAYAFYQVSTLTEVNFPLAGAVHIGSSAFDGSGIGSDGAGGEGLGELVITPGIAEISTFAFANLAWVTQLRLNTVSGLSIGYGAFSNVAGLTSVTIPLTVKYIQPYAFSDNPGLLSVTIAPSGLEYIGTNAFANTGISTFRVPNTASTIDPQQFDGCPNLTSITVQHGSPYFSSDSVVLYNSDGSTLVRYPTGLSGDYTIPDYVTSIGAFAFSETLNLEDVTFAPSSLIESIGSQAFQRSGVTSISIPANVTYIGDRAFYATSNLENVTFAPGSLLEEMGDCTFQESGIVSITIPANVTYIGDYAFYLTSNLATVTFAPGSLLPAIREGVFRESGLTSIEIPANVEAISYLAFYATASLQSVTFALGSNLQEIDQEAFRNSGLTGINLPAALETIGWAAFYSIHSLRTVTFAADSKIHDLADYAFGDTDISTITLPAGLASIGYNAFELDSRLSSVRFNGAAPSFGENVFYGTAMSKVYYYPSTAGWTDALAGSLHDYQAIPMVAPAYTADANKVTNVRVTGVAKVKKTLVAQTGSWASDFPTTYSYQWYSCSKRLKAAHSALAAKAKCKPIAGATSPTFKLTKKQKRKYVLSMVSATNEFGSTTMFGSSSARVK